jgi:membrane protease YdiL (CAAX protease family)
MVIHTPTFMAGLSVLCVVFLFLVYYLIRKYELITRLFSSEKQNPVFPYFIEKFTGFFLFGIIPFLLFVMLPGVTPAETGLTSGNFLHYWFIIVLLLIIVSVLSFFTSKMKTSQEMYPQLRIKSWNIKYSLLSIAGWIIYILGYEFLFRGILWTFCFRAFGFWPALAINILLYAIVHLDQGIGMSLGAIPVGIIFCLLTLLTGSFLFAFLIHSWMAINSELLSIYNNPDLSFNFRLKSTGV